MSKKTDDDKKAILGELLLSDEESATELKQIITSAKSLVRLDGKTKKPIVASQFDFTVPERVALILVGRHFGKELGLYESDGLKMKELASDTGIVRTTLSKPLGLLTYSGFVNQDGEKRYFIQRHKIRQIVDALHSRYVAKSSQEGIQFRTRPSSRKKPGGENPKENAENT